MKKKKKKANLVGTKDQNISIERNASTEEKIKNAARLIFHQKGFAATKTRDIAEQAGINLALLNYYFRSKEKLFNIIMLETMQKFLESMRYVFNDELSSFERKIELIAERYIDLLTEKPEIPLFLLSELRSNPEALLEKINLKEVLLKSHFLKQYRQGVSEGKISNLHWLQMVTNLMSLTVFPFVASPLIKIIGNVDAKSFNALMAERKRMIPKWIKSMLKAK